MNKRQSYGQFCPISRAAEILTTRWTPLVVRELYFGSTRFAELRRGLPRMSSALLSQRLKELEHSGILVRTPLPRGPGYSRELTPAGRALFPVLQSMGQWAQTHSRDNLTVDENLDPDLLMWNIRRRALAQNMPPEQLFNVAFQFSGVPTQKSRFWLVFKDGYADLCLRDPGYDVALTINTHVRALTCVWLGHTSLTEAIRTGQLLLEGDRHHIDEFRRWFRISSFAPEQA